MKLPPSLLDVSLREATNEVVVESETASNTEVAVEAEFMLPPEPGMTAIIVTQLDEFTSSYSDNCLSSAKKISHFKHDFDFACWQHWIHKCISFEVGIV